MNFVSFWKLVYQNKNELPGTCKTFHDDSLRVWKKSLPTNILSFSALAAHGKLPYKLIVKIS